MRKATEADAFAPLLDAGLPAASMQELARLKAMEEKQEQKGYRNASSTLDTLLMNPEAAAKLFRMGATVDDMYVLDRLGLQGTFSGALNVVLENADIILAAAKHLGAEPVNPAARAVRFRHAVLHVLGAEYPQNREHIEQALLTQKSAPNAH